MTDTNQTMDIHEQARDTDLTMQSLPAKARPVTNEGDKRTPQNFMSNVGTGHPSMP